LKSAKRKEEKEKSISSNFRTTADGRQLEKKGFWLDAERAHKFKIWCTVNRKDMSEVVDELVATFLAKSGGQRD
jgi:hypothetical protein